MATRKRTVVTPTQPTTATTSDPSTFAFHGKPTTASRPRVTRQGWAYYEKSYKDWLAGAKAYLRGIKLPRYAGPVEAFVEVVVIRPKKPVNPFPRGDLDNYAKGPLDALTKVGVWPDDNVVVKLTVMKRYTTVPAEEGIYVTVAPA